MTVENLEEILVEVIGTVENLKKIKIDKNCSTVSAQIRLNSRKNTITVTIDENDMVAVDCDIPCIEEIVRACVVDYINKGYYA